MGRKFTQRMWTIEWGGAQASRRMMGLERVETGSDGYRERGSGRGKAYQNLCLRVGVAGKIIDDQGRMGLVGPIQAETCGHGHSWRRRDEILDTHLGCELGWP